MQFLFSLACFLDNLVQAVVYGAGFGVEQETGPNLQGKR